VWRKEATPHVLAGGKSSSFPHVASLDARSSDRQGDVDEHPSGVLYPIVTIHYATSQIFHLDLNLRNNVSPESQDGGFVYYPDATLHIIAIAISPARHTQVRTDILDTNTGEISA
jgi:hypothetical protein